MEARGVGVMSWRACMVQCERTGRWESLLFMLLHDEIRRGARKESFLVAVACVGGVILVVVGGAIGREGGVEDHFS